MGCLGCTPNVTSSRCWISHVIFLSFCSDLKRLFFFSRNARNMRRYKEEGSIYRYKESHPGSIRKSYRSPRGPKREPWDVPGRGARTWPGGTKFCSCGAMHGSDPDRTLNIYIYIYRPVHSHMDSRYMQVNL